MLRIPAGHAKLHIGHQLAIIAVLNELFGSYLSKPNRTITSGLSTQGTRLWLGLFRDIPQKPIHYLTEDRFQTFGYLLIRKVQGMVSTFDSLKHSVALSCGQLSAQYIEPSDRLLRVGCTVGEV
jgi:hypothetical protein